MADQKAAATPSPSPPSEGRPERVEETLPRSIFVPVSDPHKAARETVDEILSDWFMVAISLLLIPIVLVPLLVPVPDWLLGLFDVGDVVIVAFFVVEYVAKLYLAESSKAYFLSPWHLLDLFVIAISFVSYLPFLGLHGVGSTLLLLRLLRLTRVLAVSGRTVGSRVKKKEVHAQVLEKHAGAVVRQLNPKHPGQSGRLSWEEIEAHLKTPDEEWIDLSNVSESDLVRLSGLLRVHTQSFRLGKVDDVHPHLGEVQSMSFIFLQSREVQYPTSQEEFFTIARRGVVLICTGPKLLSVSPHGTNLFDRARELVHVNGEGTGFVVQALRALMETYLEDYQRVFAEVEEEVDKISRTPRSRLPKDFLTRMYQLRKSTMRVGSSLLHFRDLLGRIVSKRDPFPGFTEQAKGEFEALADEATYLDSVGDEVSDTLETLIDVYINEGSYETNRVLKILAVITSIAIVPAAVSGILGENILGQPFQATLWEILLGMGLSMAFVVYCFIKLGWLRS